MGLMVDTSVFVHLERARAPLHFSMFGAGRPHINTIIASELLIGVSYANTSERREHRLAFVESVFDSAIVYDFPLVVARLHANLKVELDKQ